MYPHINSETGTVKLNYIDGDFILIPPPTVRVSRQLIPLISEFKAELKNVEFPLWPYEYDAALFHQFRGYYHKMSNLLGIEKYEHLETEYRHCFFICTKPTSHNGTNRLGISLLEQLLGFGYSSESPNPKVAMTTGDPFLDVITHSYLVFKFAGLESLYSLTDLHKMCKLAGDLHEAATNTKKDFVDESLELEPENEDFTRIKSTTVEQLSNLGIEIPENF